MGCGGMSGSWLSAVRDHFNERVETVGLIDLVPENAAARAREYGLSRAFNGASVEEAIETLRPDFIYNCTIPAAHFAVSSLALAQGCHVLSEKPLASSLQEARKLLALSESSGRMLTIIQNYRYHAGVIAVREALQRGVIGRVHTLNADFYIGAHFGGFRDEMDHPLLLDMAIHTFDNARFFHPGQPERVSCLTFNPSGSWYQGYPSALATFQMSGGVVFSYRGSWCAEGFPTTWAGSWRIIGEKGTLLWDGADRIDVESVKPGGNHGFHSEMVRSVIPVAAIPDSAKNHAGVISDFLTALETGGTPQTIASDNIHSLAMVEAAIESARSGGEMIAIPSTEPALAAL